LILLLSQQAIIGIHHHKTAMPCQISRALLHNTFVIHQPTAAMQHQHHWQWLGYDRLIDIK